MAAVVQIVAFGSVSAMFNPAAALMQVVAGNLGPGQFFNVVAGEMVGAFLGGLTIYVLYMPQLYKAGSKVKAGCTQSAFTRLCELLCLLVSGLATMPIGIEASLLLKLQPTHAIRQGRAPPPPTPPNESIIDPQALSHHCHGS